MEMLVEFTFIDMLSSIERHPLVSVNGRFQIILQISNSVFKGLIQGHPADS